MRGTRLILTCAVVALLFCLSVPGTGQAQCTYTKAPQALITIGGDIVIKKFPFVVVAVCSLQNSNNATCNSVAVGPVVYTLTAHQTGTNPHCEWLCPCGTIRTDTSDGLPVELMEFTIE